MDQIKLNIDNLIDKNNDCLNTKLKTKAAYKNLLKFADKVLPISKEVLFHHEDPQINLQ